MNQITVPEGQNPISQNLGAAENALALAATSLWSVTNSIPEGDNNNTGPTALQLALSKKLQADSEYYAALAADFLKQGC